METAVIAPAKKGSEKIGKENQGKRNTDMIKGLLNYFVNELKEIYWSEAAIKKQLHKMIKHTSSEMLTNELIKHFEAIKQHQIRLEEVFLVMGEKIAVVKSKAVEGLIKEVEKTMNEEKKGILKDVVIISAALKIKHYGIASYGILCFCARTLGENNAATLLHEILEDEKEANDTLSKIIESVKLQIV